MAIKLIAGRNVRAVEYIKPLLLDSDDLPREEFFERLCSLLVVAPDRVFINILVDDKQEKGDTGEPEPVGFLIATASVNRHFGFVHQAWCSPDVLDQPLKDKLFFRTCLWASTLGLTELRMETWREPSGFERRWGFIKHSTTMKFLLDNDWELKLQSTMQSTDERGDDDGKRAAKDQHTVGSTKASESPSVGLSPAGTGDRGDAVSGGADSSAGAGTGDKPGADSGV